jgi:hypothetical protein
MSAHAVASQTSGTVPLLPRDTAPSRPDNRRLPEPTTPVSRREGGAAVEDDLTPIREGRSTDASKLSFPLQLVIGIVSGTLMLYVALSGLRSDVRDISTRMEAREKLQDERSTSLKADLDFLKGRDTLRDLQIQELKEQITLLKTQRR